MQEKNAFFGLNPEQIQEIGNHLKKEPSLRELKFFAQFAFNLPQEGFSYAVSSVKPDVFRLDAFAGTLPQKIKRDNCELSFQLGKSASDEISQNYFDLFPVKGYQKQGEQAELFLGLSGKPAEKKTTKNEFHLFFIENTDSDAVKSSDFIDSLKAEKLIESLYLSKKSNLTGSLAHIAQELNKGIQINLDALASDIDETESGIIFLADEKNHAEILEKLSKIEHKIVEIGQTIPDFSLIYTQKDVSEMDIPLEKIAKFGIEYSVKNELGNEEKKANATSIEVEDYKQAAINLLNSDSVKHELEYISSEKKSDIFAINTPEFGVYAEVARAEIDTDTSLEQSKLNIIRACRNLISSGAENPMLASCINLPEISQEAIIDALSFNQKLKNIAHALNICIISEQISFIPDAPKVYDFAMIGTLNDSSKKTARGFNRTGDLIFMLGTTKDELCGSEFLKLQNNDAHICIQNISINEEKELQIAIKDLIRHRYIKSAYPVSKGGIFAGLTACGLSENKGFDIETNKHIAKQNFLFGESEGRILVSVSNHLATDFMKFMLRYDTKADYLGVVTAGDIVINNEYFGQISDMLHIENP